MQSKALETIDKPLTVNHETSKLYSALRQCMQNNQELRDALLDAAETIEKLTEALSKADNSEKLNENKSN